MTGSATTTATGRQGGRGQHVRGLPLHLAETLQHVESLGFFPLPLELAAEVLRRLNRDVFNEARGLGIVASPGARRLLEGLYGAAQRYKAATEGVATTDTLGGEQPLSVREAAERMGCSASYVRQLLATGRLTGRKSGGVWIVHPGPVLATSQAPQRSA